jgi:hypothetical protein
MNEPLFKPQEVNKSPMAVPDTASKRAQTTQDLMLSRGLGQAGVPGEYYPGEDTQLPVVADVDEYGQRPATPEEQAVLQQFVDKAQTIIMKGTPTFVQNMVDRNRPVYQTVGELALTIVEGVKNTAEAGGQEIDQDTMLAAGEEVVELLMDLGDKANVFPFAGGSDEYMETMSMALMFGAETKARQLIEEGDPEIKASYEDKLAMEIAREVDQGQGPPDEFFRGMEDAKRELPRRAMYGVK